MCVIHSVLLAYKSVRIFVAPPIFCERFSIDFPSASSFVAILSLFNYPSNLKIHVKLTINISFILSYIFLNVFYYNCFVCFFETSLASKEPPSLPNRLFAIKRKKKKENH